MTYWRCIKCAYTHHGSKGQTAYKCSCGRWCVNITEIVLEMREKGDLTANQVIFYQELLEVRCLQENI